MELKKVQRSHAALKFQLCNRDLLHQGTFIPDCLKSQQMRSDQSRRDPKWVAGGTGRKVSLLSKTWRMKWEAFWQPTNDVLLLVLMNLKWWCFSTETVDFSNQDTGTPSESQRSHVAVCYAPCGRNSTITVFQWRRNGSASSGDKKYQLSRLNIFYIVYFYTTFKNMQQED